jgi:hypothetical protein
MNRFVIISILTSALWITGCEKENNNEKEVENENNISEEFHYEATVLRQGMDCGETYLISLKSIVTNSDIEDGTYYADQLDSDFKVQGLKIYLNCRKPNASEFYACTDMGPSYPHVIVTNYQRQECGNLLLKTESLENLYGCPDTRYGLDCSLVNDFEIIRNQQSFLDFTTGTCRPEIDFQSYDLIVGKWD